MENEEKSHLHVRRKIGQFISVAWLAWIFHAASKQLIKHFPPSGAKLNNDAYWTYLPNARKLLEHPWDFLTTDPSSYHVAPLGYAWAALWGGDPTRIQLANCVLFLACILMMWRCATQLGGICAGIVATYLLVHVPQLVTYVPQILTESIYLFGLVLCLTFSVEYWVGGRRSRYMLAIAALGLTITLLSRPVLQIFAILALVISTSAIVYLHNKTSEPATKLRSLSSNIRLALLAALLLPAAVMVKNGLCFDFWGLGTGAGSGLYYGISPFKMGHEPVYSGFNYDAGVAPKAAIINFDGKILSKEADQINTRVAVEIIKNTSLTDNFFFFLQKFKSWVFFSTPDLRMHSELRRFRYFEWLSIILAALALAIRYTRNSAFSITELPGAKGRDREKLIILATLILITVGMALQLTPVLYNTRYNIFFMEPWLILLCAASLGILLHVPNNQLSHSKVNFPRQRIVAIGGWLLPKLAALLLLAWLPNALTKHALRHETWSMDPHRPGPVQVVLDRASMGDIYADHATPLEGGRWRLDAWSSTIFVPLHVADPQKLAPSEIMDAIWRLRFAVTATNAPRACKHARLTVSKAYPSQDWYEPEAMLSLTLDGAMHSYAHHGNDQLRPAGSGQLAITFACPPGTTVSWGGAELLRSRVGEAAQALVQRGEPIIPYDHNDPR